VVALTDVRLLTSIPTWLSSGSLNSVLRMVSSSTPKTWLLALPLLAVLRKPRYWLGSAFAKLSLPTKKTMPWPLRSE
jgi:hypothetical protein